MKPEIKKGPQGGRFQNEKVGRRTEHRYLLEKKVVKTGPQGGKFQVYDGKKKRYLLHSS